jgi:membrane-associated protein
MEYAKYVIDLFLHLDRHLAEIIRDYGLWTYLILFAIIFCETGLVVTPFLPGDSLLFAAGAFSAAREVDGVLQPGPLNVWWLFLLLSAAAIIGDTVNYWVGAWIGPKAFSGQYRFLKREYLDRTHRFYERHGGKTIILARFVPIIRTFAPFVAGIGAMNYSRFIAYNVIGAVLWVGIFVFLGCFFGNLPWVQKNFIWVIVAIIILSVMPMVYEYWRARVEARHAQPQPTE